MSMLWILVPLSLVLSVTWLVAFIGAGRNGQFDDIEKEAQRMVFTGEEPSPKLGPNESPKRGRR